MTIICETSVILNSYCAAIMSIEIAARYNTCFSLQRKYKQQNNIQLQSTQSTI